MNATELHELGSEIEAAAQINPGEPVRVDTARLLRGILSLKPEFLGRMLMLGAREGVAP